MKTKPTIKNLQITIIQIMGKCPIYKLGENFHLNNGYILESKKASRSCMHSLSSLLPYYVALSHGIKPVSLGLNKKENNKAYVQCLDACEYTGGGTVIFEVEILE